TPGPEQMRTVAQTQTAAPGTQRLTLEGGVEAELQHTSVMRIEESGARVEGGAVKFKVPHRRQGHPFVVHADRYHVVVIATRLVRTAASTSTSTRASSRSGTRRCSSRASSRASAGTARPAPTARRPRRTRTRARRRETRRT